MNILGISAFYHDSAACLIQEGYISAAAQEERFTRKKHDESFPIHALDYCLKEGNLDINDVDLLVFYENPAIKFNRIVGYLHINTTLSRNLVENIVDLWSKNKLWQEEIIRAYSNYTGKIIFPLHHQSHAASAFFPSPYNEAAIITVDGVGEYHTVTIGIGKRNQIKILKSINFPNSLGMLYSAFTFYCGFKVNSGEYKMMGLAPYGEPKYVDLIKDNLIDIKDDGSFHLNMDYFDFFNNDSMINDAFRNLFGARERKHDEPLAKLYIDLAKSIQTVLEEVMIKIAVFTKKLTGKDNLCMAGGVALNCVANYKILDYNIFKNIWIQPASGDAGGALGAALFGWHQYLNYPRITDEETDQMRGSLLGPSFKNEEIKNFLDSVNATYEELNEDDLIEWISNKILQEKVIGHFNGRMEFGPRALGNRSILGDARSPNLQKIMNLKIKFRENFRPFAPSILEEHTNICYKTTIPMPYMLFSVPVSDEIRLEINEDDKCKKGIDKLGVIRSKIPAVTHVDYSARIQTVSKDNLRYYRIIKAVYEKTGLPTIINTSFNIRGEPIVCSPEDAFNCFMNTYMDCLVLNNFILEKEKQQKNVIFDCKQKFAPD
jgi:carbamoyltransferase